jgi:hypothetical protein
MAAVDDMACVNGAPCRSPRLAAMTLAAAAVPAAALVLAATALAAAAAAAVLALAGRALLTLAAGPIDVSQFFNLQSTHVFPRSSESTVLATS